MEIKKIMERYVYLERNVPNLMRHYLAGRTAVAEEIRMAHIEYFPEDAGLEESSDESAET